MAIGDDFEIQSGKNIRHVSGSSTYTVLALHRWLQDKADDASMAGDDYMDITQQTPSERSTDNIITLINGYNIDDAAAEYLYDGSIQQDGGNVLYSGLVVVGALAGTTTLQIVQNKVLYDGDAPFWGTGLNADASQNILMRCLIKTRATGADIDGKRILVFAREWGHTWAEFSVTMGLGNSVAAIFTSTDLNNATLKATVAGWTTIDNKHSGYNTIDLGNGNGLRPYFSEWNKDVYTINQLYERCKWLACRGTAETLYGLDAELFRGITHEFAYDNEAGGNFTEGAEITWATGTGQLLALKDDGTTGTMWMQLTSGTAPSDGVQISQTGGKTCDVNGTVTSRTLSPVFLGQSTGTALIGGFGIGVESTDLSKDDKLFDLTNIMQQPPNLVTFKVTELVVGEDYVLVGPKESGGGSDFDFDQLTLNTSLSGAGETAVVVTTAIPSDTPSTGTIRIQLNSGRYKKVSYTSWATSTFTIPSTDFTSDPATAPKNVMISYIDKLSTVTQEQFQCFYSADRNLWIRVRDGGASPIKTFESGSQLLSGGGSVAAIRTPDA